MTKIYIVPQTRYLLFVTDGSYKIIRRQINYPIILKNGKYVVELDWFNGLDYYDFDLVLIMSFYYNKYPIHVIKEIEVIHIDGDICNNNIDNLFYRFKNGPIESEEKKGYYYIPYYSNYLITKDCNLYSIKSKRILIPYKYYFKNDKKNRTGGYNTYNILKDGSEINSQIGKHRLIGLCFLKYDFSPFKYVVNHKDGIPGNDKIDNLEWVSRKENNQHAYNNNLLPNKVVPITYHNWRTGITKSYINIATASKDLQLGVGLITKRLDIIKKYIDGHCFIRKDGNIDINTLIRNMKLPETPIYTMGVRMTCYAKHIKTGSITQAKNIMELSNLIDVNTTSISHAIKQKSNKPVKGYYIYSDLY